MTALRSLFSTRQCSASYGKGVTRLSPHCYYPSLACLIPRFASNRAYLGSFGTASLASHEFEGTRGKVTANMERNVLRHHTELVCLNARSQLKGGLTAVCTKLCWVACGAYEIISNRDKNAPTLCASLEINDFNTPDLWSLEAIRILNANKNLTKAAEEEIARNHFSSSLTRKEIGHYCVGLPCLGSSVEIPSNYQVAEKRLFDITLKLI
ncbi:integrase catalytic domain-containing protein [Trichonephila clavipes]|nr:integrase catalytic domain-containing protein [Trichonephila clavipes]